MEQYGLKWCTGCYFCLPVLLTMLTIPVYAATNCQLSSSSSGCTIQVQATIMQGCLVSNSSTSPIGSLDFGSIPTLPTNTRTASLVLNEDFRIDCTPNSNITMSINGGVNNNGGNRNMSNTAGSKIPYFLYSNSALTTPIGIDQPVSIPTNNGSNISLPIYGKVQITQSYSSGSYNDTLIVSLSW